MDKNMIYKMVFEEISDSREWSCDCENSSYSWYIDGVVSLATRILNKLDELSNKEVCCKSEDIDWK